VKTTIDVRGRGLLPWIHCFGNGLPIRDGPPYACTPVAERHIAKKPVGQISRELRNPVLAHPAPVDVGFRARAVGDAHGIVASSRARHRRTRAANAKNEIFVTVAEAAELGHEVLFLAKLFHHPRIAFAMHRHGTLRKRQRRIVAQRM
jgi:hypothetical protein